MWDFGTKNNVEIEPPGPSRRISILLRLISVPRLQDIKCFYYEI